MALRLQANSFSINKLRTRHQTPGVNLGQLSPRTLCFCFVFCCYYMNQFRRSITEYITTCKYSYPAVHCILFRKINKLINRFQDFSTIDMIDPILFKWNVAPGDNPICFVFNQPLSSKTFFFFTLSPMTDHLLNLNGFGDTYFCCSRHKLFIMIVPCGTTIIK